MVMSKFFRSANSSDSGSETSSDASEDAQTREEEEASQSLSEMSISSTGNGSRHDPGLQVALDRPRNGSAQAGRDMLLHALLEERCLDQVRKARLQQGRNTDDHDAIQQEAKVLYHQTCSQLVPLNLVSSGFDHDRHTTTRQTVRDGLDRIAANTLSRDVARTRSSFPAPPRRLLTAPEPSSAPTSPASLLDSVANPSIFPSRYAQDFEELQILGRGGFGEVYQVRHKLDNCIYAVKKIPIRQSALTRIASGGQAALDELLAEVRSLSRLDHPNVVRYFNSWIEWSAGSGQEYSSSDIHVATQNSNDPTSGAESAHSGSGSVSFGSLHRVQTQSDTEELAITFETSNAASLQETAESREASSVANHTSRSLSRVSVSEASNGVTLTRKAPTLALHMQMSVHPLTLAEFLSPTPTDSPVPPLSHCFHLKPSLQILLSLLDGVEYLHSENMIHRDLKPANIFLKHESNPRATKGHFVDLSLCPDCRAQGTTNPAKLSICIGDFGLVTQLAATESPPKIQGGATPAVGTVVGTEIYRPSSSQVATPPSPHLDIYALGVIACELLCKFTTQMERRATLTSLRTGTCPVLVAAGNHSPRVQAFIALMLSGAEKVEIGEVRRKVGEILAEI